MAQKIYALSVQALGEKKFVGFMRFVNQAIDDNPIVEQSLSFFVNRFKAAYEHLDYVFLKYDIDACAQAAREADTARGIAFRKMRDAIKWFVTFPESEAKTKAAEELLRVIDMYGGVDIPSQGMTAKSASISNLIDDFEQRYPADVATLGVGPLVEELKAAQQLFDEKYMARTVCESEQVKGAMAEARKAMGEEYRLLVDAINVKVQEDMNGQLIAFIKILNVEIGKNRTLTGQGQVGSTSGSGSSESEEGGIVYKYATFDFIGGNLQKYRLEVGAPLPIVPNTEGYKWKPEVMEFMPAKNITFKEVPLVEAEATATFHYLDHTEEKIKQIVGSILKAPANTTGCIWIPTVPATMPAEDTSYFEQQVSSGGGTGGEEQEPTKYWIAFVFADGTQEDAEYTEGATITYPTPTTGYRWPASAPTTMPAHDVTVTEERNPNQPPPATGGGESGFD